MRSVEYGMRSIMKNNHRVSLIAAVFIIGVCQVIKGDSTFEREIKRSKIGAIFEKDKIIS